LKPLLRFWLQFVLLLLGLLFVAVLPALVQPLGARLATKN
jgi:hypothetical protein